jgi:hypothetical protein
MFPAVVVLDHFLKEYWAGRNGGGGGDAAVRLRGCGPFRRRQQTAPPDGAAINPVAVGEAGAGSGATGGRRGDGGGFQSVSDELRPVERFFATVWAPLVSRFARPIVVVFGVLALVVGAVYTVNMQMAKTQVQLRAASTRGPRVPTRPPPRTLGPPPDRESAIGNALH